MGEAAEGGPDVIIQVEVALLASAERSEVAEDGSVATTFPAREADARRAGKML